MGKKEKTGKEETTGKKVRNRKENKMEKKERKGTLSWAAAPHCPPLLTPGQGSMTIFNVWFLILQATSLDRIWPKVNLFWSDFGEKCIFRVF